MDGLAVNLSNLPSPVHAAERNLTTVGRRVRRKALSAIYVLLEGVDSFGSVLFL